MFRPLSFLQVAALSFLLTGCASSGGPPPAPSGANPSSAARTTDSQATRPGTERARQAAPPPASPAPAGDFVQADQQLTPAVRDFAQATAHAHDLPAAEVESLLREARYDARAARLIAPHKRTGRIRRAWQSYRKRHVDPIRIREGVHFWQAHQRALQAASEQTGVPPGIIVAIIGIETVYGRFTGDHRVLDTLTTLGFRYPDPNRPERQTMFRKQLADLLVLHHQGQLDARTAQGSYAGAMGLPQFMPGSILRWAADGDGDGRIDLHDSTADAIASVAAYLKAHGWTRDVPVFAPVSLPPATHRLVQEGLEPETDWATLQAAGASSRSARSRQWQAQPLGVIDLQDEIRNTHDYRCATPNFFAITHYNRSYFYAASVADLAEAITRRVRRTQSAAIS